MFKGTILFDFDSTVIKGESFELILKPKLKNNPKLLEKIEEITIEGMSGRLSFYQSVQARFALASPSIFDIEHFVSNSLPKIITDGFFELFKKLKRNGYDLWIISGGLKRVIEPFADYLGIGANVIALEADWNQKGEFIKLKQTPSLQSKVLAVDALKDQLTKPVIIVGDGYTDYELKASNIAEYFIYYSEHIKRETVIKYADVCAASALDLDKMIISYFSK